MFSFNKSKSTIKKVTLILINPGVYRNQMRKTRFYVLEIKKIVM